MTPSKCLRHKATRELFTWTGELNGRWFTVNMVGTALARIVKEKKLQPPHAPGFSLETWLNDESACLQKLLVKSRKNASNSRSAMDGAETQPWPELDPAEEKHLYLHDSSYMCGCDSDSRYICMSKNLCLAGLPSSPGQEAVDEFSGAFP